MIPSMQDPDNQKLVVYTLIVTGIVLTIYFINLIMGKG